MNIKTVSFKLPETINGEDLSEYSYIKAESPSPIKLIVVAGNPGIIDFYSDFIKILFLSLNGKYDIYSIGHLGHCGRIEKVFSVEEQIKHKELFLDYLLENDFKEGREDVKFILLGHSVGSYISLKVVNRYSDKFNFISVCNLFPTFKNLYDGLSPFIKMVVMRESTRSGFSTFLHYIPNLMRHAILRFILAENDSRISVNEKINYWSALNILYMAYTEALDIKEIDDECHNVFKSRLNQLLFIYGQTDNYTPKSFYQEMKDMYPNGNIEFASANIPHAFVLHHSKDIALRVSEWLKSNILNLEN
ncbi:hypothetical protein DICPUDRAFT_158110 [Dictyostelium purpureum]|uniref:Serine aminopeptidase S33 domain-containing protein n=1 Tax=Dictyostelium purpureum TaxID=5786 RepID=F1A0V4_DICPU|nr:uncharacterized protein DICPUDRAFT_158110 [Dictyostelium purpureum]EGC30176.1 hypothetical protein DICPUDRAFT_158110 [Dictyostelium purpureum]|eukprot:XP_003293302.1 hypothetical protein DICPUDRAFT_158110 [Dictyostelium purpureum]